MYIHLWRTAAWSTSQPKVILKDLHGVNGPQQAIEWVNRKSWLISGQRMAGGDSYKIHNIIWKKCRCTQFASITARNLALPVLHPPSRKHISTPPSNHRHPQLRRRTLAAYHKISTLLFSSVCWRTATKCSTTTLPHSVGRWALDAMVLPPPRTRRCTEGAVAPHQPWPRRIIFKFTLTYSHAAAPAPFLLRSRLNTCTTSISTADSKREPTHSENTFSSG